MPELFVLCLGLLLAGIFIWAFRTLPAENWQFIASIPLARGENGWKGVNLTWFGLISATAYALAVAIFVLLMGSVGAPFFGSLLAVVALLVICAPASAIITRLVEGRRNGFTVAGTLFVGVLVAPAIFLGLDAVRDTLGFQFPVGAALAAACTAFVLGEGVGRLACISFGCCYGKPVSETKSWLRWFSSRFYFRFFGTSKKIAFAGGLEGVKVVPVQAMTATVHSLVALACMLLFFADEFGWTIALAMGTTQPWRILSETFRADFLGTGTISPYQVMAGVTTIAALWAPYLFAEASSTAVFEQGVEVLATAEVFIFLQALWLFLFVYMGRSMQTGSEMRFFVRRGSA